MLQRVSMWLVGLCLVAAGCKSYEEQRNELPDTPDRGSVRVSADETFKPIVDELVQVYESNHPGTKITVDYKTDPIACAICSTIVFAWCWLRVVPLPRSGH